MNSLLTNNKYFYLIVFFLIILTNPKHANAVDLASTVPADNATQIAVNTGITLEWAGSVTTNDGNVILKKASDDSTVETFASNGMFLITDMMTGNVSAILSLSSNLDEDTEYYILIDSAAFDGFNGISSKTTLNFKTVDNNNPSLTSSSPSDDASNVNVSSNIVLTFNEAVDVENGNIHIINTSNGEPIAIDVTGTLLSGSGTTEITINPSSDLEHETSYHVKIDSSAFDDAAGNSYPGISSTTALNFSTKPGEVFNETVKTLTKNQTVAATNSLNQSVNRIAGRMNYIRSTNNNSSNQNIRLAMNFDNELLAEMLNSLYSKAVKKQKVTEKWGVWSEGNISFGRIGQQDGNLGQDIHSDGVTFGIDKKINKDKTVGLAISKSWQETKVGSNNANMDAVAVTIMNYTSFKIEDKRYFEMVAGIGEMDIDLSRDVTGGKNIGDRKGNQLFGSFTYLLEPNVEIVGRNLNYYTRIDLGFTQLKAYTETGDATAVSYKKQNVKSGSLSAGLNLSKLIEINKGILEPSLKFELGKDKTINSVSEAYYINNPSEIHSNAIGDQSSGHLLLNLGLGAKFKNGLSINTSYEHYRGTKDNFNNSFSIYLRKPL